MATTSAWAVGSQVEVTWLLPRPTTFPARTTTQPKGPPRPERTPSSESRMASRMKLSLLTAGVPGSVGWNARRRDGTMEVTGHNEEVTFWPVQPPPLHDRHHTFRPRNPRADPAPLRRDPDPRGLRLPGRALPEVRARAARSSSRAASPARPSSTRERSPTSWPSTRPIREGDLAGGARPRRPPRPPDRDHGPGRPQDGDQRPQLGREGVHGRLRGRDLADLGEPPRRATSTCGTPCGARSRSRAPRERPTS